MDSSNIIPCANKPKQVKNIHFHKIQNMFLKIPNLGGCISIFSFQFWIFLEILINFENAVIFSFFYQLVSCKSLADIELVQTENT